MSPLNQRIAIRTELSNFLLIDEITAWDATKIKAVKTFDSCPPFLALEALAQTGAYHARALLDFERHAFLLKIAHSSFPAGNFLKGRYEAEGTLTGRSERAFRYHLRLTENGNICVAADFLIGTADYETVFSGKNLRQYYQEVFACLQKDTQKG